MSGRWSTPGATAARAAAAVVAMATTIAAVSCSATSPDTEPTVTEADSSAVPGPGPFDRVVAVVTSACGSAPAAIGSAVRLDPTTVLTVAHVVAGAGSVAVVEHESLPPDRDWPGFSPGALFDRATAARVGAFDPERDLALVTIDRPQADGTGFAPPEFGTAAQGDAVAIHGAATTAIEGSVALRTTIVSDEVRGGGRVERDGYRLDAATDRGDSGAGVWSTDGRLVGVVFAVSSNDGSRTWAVSGREIAEFLDAVEVEPAASYRCDEATSRLIASP